MSISFRRVRDAGLSSTLLPLSARPSCRATRVRGADFTLTDTLSRSELSSDSDSLVILLLVPGPSEEDVSGLQPSILNIMSSGSGRVDRDDVLEGLWVDLVAWRVSEGLCLMEDRTLTDLSLDPDHHGRVGALLAAPVSLARLLELSAFLRVCFLVCLSVCLLVCR